LGSPSYSATCSQAPAASIVRILRDGATSTTEPGQEEPVGDEKPEATQVDEQVAGDQHEDIPATSDRLDDAPIEDALANATLADAEPIDATPEQDGQAVEENAGGTAEQFAEEPAAEPQPTVALAIDEEEEPLGGLAGFRLNAPAHTGVALGRHGEFRVASTDEGEFAAVSGFRDDERVVVFYEGNAYEFELAARGSVGGHGIADGVIAAPMPGKVTAVEVSQGDMVNKGQRLLTLEAMKMEHGLTAPFDGTVAELSAAAGAQVGEGTILARVEPKETK